MIRRALASTLLLGVTATACAGASSAPVARPTTKANAPAEAPAPSRAGTTRELTADETLTAPSGATFQAAKGWSVTTRDGLLVLDSPERDLAITLVDVGETDPDAAITYAWKRVAPKFDRKTKQRTEPPAREGWDAITQIVYDTAASESRVIIALARKKGERTHVALIDGTNAGLDRRGANLGTIVSSYKPKGLEEESFAGKKAHVLDAARLATLTAFVEESRKAADVPGAAVAIVQDGKVVLAKGFGVKEAGKADLVTPKTLFMIASMTKSLATLMMAKLVDEGAFTWDTPVTKVLPTFALGDPEATRQLTMRHTVCACTGLPRQDAEFLFEYGGVTPEMRVESMRTMKPTTAFGETFQYSNTMVATGGFAAAHLVEPKKPLGAAFDAALRAKVLGPLGMRSTTLDPNVAKRVDHATPHGLTLELRAQPTPLLQDDEPVAALRPSGGAWSNVEDIARVMLLELGRGTLDGKRIVSEANLMARRQPQAKISDKSSYGLGLFIENDHHARVVGHGGNLLGFTSDYFWLPDHGVGMVVLANAGSANSLRNALKRRLLEVLFDGRAEAKENLAFGLARRKEATEKELSRVSVKPATAFVDKLVGTWSNPGLGKVTIRKDKERAVFDVGEWSSSFGEKTEADGAKSVVLLDPPHAGFDFLVQEKDGTTTLLLDMSQQKYVFTREGSSAK